MENFHSPENNNENKSTFDDFVERIGSTDLTVYEQLNASNDKEAKAEFLANPDLVHPRNEYDNLDVDKVLQNLATLNSISKELRQSWLTDKESRLVEMLTDDNRKKNEFLLANFTYNNANTPEDKALATREHKRTNEALYGVPDEATFYCILQEKISKITPKTPEEQDRLDDLLNKIGTMPEAQSERFKPKQETVERFSELIKDFFGDFLKHLPDGKDSFTSEELAGIINDILESEFDGDSGYKAVIDSKVANASANHEQRIIKFPEGKEYSRNRAAALIVHELGTHVMRAIPYMEHDIPAFSKGLPNNETFDEGIAKCVEQAISGRYEDSGIDHYINIGLANFKGKNFRDIYDIQMAIKELSGEKTDTVLNAVQRCFRGTGELPNNKDLAYYNGANQVWQYIEGHIDDPELMDNLFLSGKAIITNKNQEQLVYETKVGGI